MWWMERNVGRHRRWQPSMLRILLPNVCGENAILTVLGGHAAHWPLTGTTKTSCFQVIIPMGSGPPALQLSNDDNTPERQLVGLTRVIIAAAFQSSEPLCWDAGPGTSNALTVGHLVGSPKTRKGRGLCRLASQLSEASRLPHRERPGPEKVSV